MVEKRTDVLVTLFSVERRTFLSLFDLASQFRTDARQCAPSAGARSPPKFALGLVVFREHELSVTLITSLNTSTYLVEVTKFTRSNPYKTTPTIVKRVTGRGYNLKEMIIDVTARVATDRYYSALTPLQMLVFRRSAQQQVVPHSGKYDGIRII
jgi:hypothetical protein